MALMSDLKYNPEGYLYAELKPRYGEIILFKPNADSDWRIGKVQMGGVADRFPDDYEIESYRGCLRFPEHKYPYAWKYPPIEDQRRIYDEIERAYGRKK
jgi:hypothetical protein